MARIGGDTEDLPAGWTVDRDNWGVRAATARDQKRLYHVQSKRNAPKWLYSTACIEGGRLFVMSARTARFFDAADA